LVALGYEHLVAVEEIRTGALVDDVLVAVDTLARLGDFIKLEATVPQDFSSDEKVPQDVRTRNRFNAERGSITVGTPTI
jgi:adenylate cyclase class IV